MPSIRDVPHAWLPGFSPDGDAGIGLSMDVVLPYAGEQLCEMVRPRWARRDHESALIHGDLDLRVLDQADFERKRLGNSDCQTVPPLLDSSVRARLPVATLTLRLSIGAVKPNAA